MVQAHEKKGFSVFASIFCLLLFSGSLAAQHDPPSRVARLNYINGNVSMEPAGVDEWAPAEINRPFTVGDYLYADQGGAAELHLDIAAMRIGSQTSFGFLNLDDRTVQLKLTEGDMYFRVHNFGVDQVFEVDTPNAAVNLLRDGIYRFRVDANGRMTYLVVRQGEAQVTGAGQAFTLNADNSATLTGTDQLAYNIELAPQPDEFDQWCEQRDAHEARLASGQYLPPTVIGYEDLDDYGTWQQNVQYGVVWYPRTVDAGWAPYQYGHWAWIDPWGWTWVDSMPWGFAPFHYGRWAYINNRWGWCPGPVVRGFGPVVRPYYAPALVAWLGGAHWGVSISAGGSTLGWIPLGWGEVYTPSYHCSPRYFNDVNVYNTRFVHTVNITNVYNTVYVNKTVYNQTLVNARAPNAVVAMPQSAFASGLPVRQAAIPVRQVDVARIQSASVVAPNVAPTQQALVPASVRPVVRPGPQVTQRQVIARSTPPAVTVHQVAQQGGQPTNQQPARPVVRPVAANVRQVAAVTPVAVRPGQRVGTSPELERPRAPVSQSATAVRPNQPAPAPRPTPAVARNQLQSAEQVRPTQPVSPPSHGVPPNLRQSGAVPAENGRYNTRSPQPVEPSRAPAAPPAPAETNRQPAQPNHPVYTAPVQPNRHPTPAPTPERSQPAVAHGTPPNRQQQVPERPVTTLPAQPATATPRTETMPSHQAAAPRQTVPQERTRPESQPIRPEREPVVPENRQVHGERPPIQPERRAPQSYPSQTAQPRQSAPARDDHSKNQKSQ